MRILSSKRTSSTKREKSKESSRNKWWRNKRSSKKSGWRNSEWFKRKSMQTLRKCTKTKRNNFSINPIKPSQSASTRLSWMHLGLRKSLCSWQKSSTKTLKSNSQRTCHNILLKFIKTRTTIILNPWFQTKHRSCSLNRRRSRKLWEWSSK